jgi:hypothetical protein
MILRKTIGGGMPDGETGGPQHPSLETLALFSGGDLPWVARLRVGRHVARCGACDQDLALFRSAAAKLKREAANQTLTGFEAIAHWPALEREMLGNIAVGVDAARCIENVGRKRAAFYKFALVGGLASLFLGAWINQIQGEQTRHFVLSLRQAMGLDRSQRAETVLRSTPEGIAVHNQGATLTILHPPSAVVSVSGSSAMAARYVDTDGQVTITNVSYGQ